MMRKLGYGQDWQRTQVNGVDLLKMNKSYKYVYLVYLPSFDDSKDYWYFLPDEYQFVFDLSWIEINYRSAESQFSGVTLGVGSDAKQLIDHYDKERERIFKELQEQSVFSYLG
jgi:hypothetical protein